MASRARVSPISFTTLSRLGRRRHRFDVVFSGPTGSTPISPRYVRNLDGGDA